MLPLCSVYISKCVMSSTTCEPLNHSGSNVSKRRPRDLKWRAQGIRVWKCYRFRPYDHEQGVHPSRLLALNLLSLSWPHLGMQMFLGQGWNLSHSCNQSCSSDCAGSLTHWFTRELSNLQSRDIKLWLHLETRKYKSLLSISRTFIRSQEGMGRKSCYYHHYCPTYMYMDFSLFWVISKEWQFSTWMPKCRYVLRGCRACKQFVSQWYATFCQLFT